LFSTCEQEKLNGRRISMPRGKVLGGTSAINGMLYVRGQAQDYDNWAQVGNIGWSFSDVLPLFKKSISNFSEKQYLDEDYHSGTGELHVNSPRTTYTILDQFIEAAGGCGYRKFSDYNGQRQDGFNYFQLTQKNGFRHSSYQAFIAPIIKKRKNIDIITSAHVLGLSFADDGRIVTGVQIEHRGEKKFIRANREVVLCAGSIGSPQILELSGIGDSERLRSIGIEPKLNLPAVGENLTDHFLTRLTWQLSTDLSLNNSLRGLGLIKEIMRFIIARRGAMTMPAGIVGGFVASPFADNNRPDVQFHVAHASFANPSKRIFDQFPAISIGPCQLRPLSRGYSHINNPNPIVSPVINPRYLTEKIDELVLLEGIRIARQIMTIEPMKSLICSEARPGSDCVTDDELIHFVKSTGNTVYHPVSTCRMGPKNQNNHVLTPDLRVRGADRLRVADASIMPFITSGNTNAPTMMIAEKAANLILGH
jgi:choline dehydrogenase